jgi:hypothetical protein
MECEDVWDEEFEKNGVEGIKIWLFRSR